MLEDSNHIYKYCSKIKYMSEILKQNKIYLSSPFYFNDIFDSSTIIDWTDFDNVFFSSSYEYILLKCCDDTYIDKVKFIIKAHKCIHSDNSLSDIFCVLENNNLPIEEIGKKFIEKLQNAKPSTYKIACFSKVNNSLIMWAHYAKCLEGVCFRFNKSLDEELNKIKEVNYTAVREHGNSDIPIFTKAMEWEYEKELRYVKDLGVNALLDLNEKHYLITPSCDGIIYGNKFIKKHNNVYSEFNQFIKTHNLKIEQFIAKPSANEYKINIEPIK